MFLNSLAHDGGVHLSFTPPKPGHYALDFALSHGDNNGQPITLQLSQLGAPPQNQFTPVGDGHALFLVDLTGGAAPLFVLQSNGSTTFYSVEISLVK